jgi:hypothetical protein
MMKRSHVASFSSKRFVLERPFALSTSQMGMKIPGRSERSKEDGAWAHRIENAGENCGAQKR